MENSPTVFLSYSWANGDAAEKIFSDLKQVGITVIKDNHQLKYKDDLTGFMQGIRDADFALILISEEYLKSVNCMFEACQLLNERDAKKKLLPVIVDGTSIYKTENRIELISHWQGVIKDLETKLNGIDPTLAIEVYKDLKAIKEVVQAIDGFLKMVTSMLVITLKELTDQNYKPVLDAVGVVDVTYLTDLLETLKANSVDELDLLLDQYLSKHSANTFYYVFKANNLKRQGKFKQAEFNYQEALRLKSDNYEALNNLGYLYDIQLKEYEKAKKCYEQALRIAPQMTVARLNLGILKDRHFNDPEGAKRQYEKILSYDPFSAPAYNNLANYYRGVELKPQNSLIVENLLKKALQADPSFINTYINYGNFLKLSGRFQEGNDMYSKALELDKDGNYTEFLNALLKSKKG